VDPLNEWKRDPFDPTIQDGKFWDAGAGTRRESDHAAPRGAGLARVEGRPPINLKFVVEGEEEVGSPHFASFVNANKEILKADGATIEGGDHLHEGTPKIELAARASCTSRWSAGPHPWTNTRPTRRSPEPLVAHARPHDTPGCERADQDCWLYEDARRPTARELRFLKSSVFSAQALKEYWGVSEFIGGDNDFELLRRLIYSPTCTICGFVSGYIEQGTKTVNRRSRRRRSIFALSEHEAEKQLAKLREH